MQGLLDLFGLGGGGASPATPQPPMFGFPGMSPEEQAFARTRAMQTLLGTVGSNFMAASQGGIPLAQAGALRAQAMSAAAQAPMLAMQAGDQAGQQMLQQRALRSQIAQREAQVASGQRMANFLLGGGGGATVPPVAPAAPAAAVSAATSSATPAATTSAPQPLDLDLAARVLHMEAGNQGPEGLAAVAHVIRNRANLTGRSLSEVVSQPGQFEPFATRRDQINALRPEQYADARRVIEGVVAGQIPDPTRGATHFLNPELVAQRGGQRPAWAPEGQGTRIGAHEFFSIPQDFRQAGGATPAAAPAGGAPLSPQQAALVAPVNGAAPRTPGFNGNSLANMPAELRVLAAESFARGDHEGGQRIVSDWLTRNPPSVQTVNVGGRVRELRPDASLGQDYGPANDRGPVMTEAQITGLGVPAQSARMIASLGTREEQDQAIRALATREAPRPSEGEDALRTQFQALAPVTRYAQSVPLFQAISRNVDRIRTSASAGRPDLLGELDLVVSIANLFDPGSVVREGEVANVIRTQGLNGDVQRALGYATSGQRLPGAVLDQVVASAADRMTAYREAVQPYANAYRGLAERRGLNPDNVILDLGDPVAEVNERRRAGGVNGPPGVQPPAGAAAADIANRIRERFPNDPAMRRRAATAAGINPSLVE